MWNHFPPGILRKTTVSHESSGGFTLLEISIVLVVIGLISGGVFAGATLIRTMELRSIQTEANEYLAAIASFRDRYEAYPGDMPNATKIWGQVGDSGAGTCPTGKGNGTETCDGNGDQKIAPVSATFGAAPDDREAFRAWEQMQNAGLLGVSVTGVTGSLSTRHSLVGENIPRSRFSKAAGWALFNIPYIHSAAGALCATISTVGGLQRVACHFHNAPPANDHSWLLMETHYENVLMLGANSPQAAPSFPVIAAKDAAFLDKKFDDGLPGAGTLLAAGDYAGFADAAPDCYEAVNASAGYTVDLAYSINETEQGCAFIFIQK